MFKVNNRNTRTTSHLHSVTLLYAHVGMRIRGLLYVKCDVVLLFLLSDLNIFYIFFQCFYCLFEQVNVSWVAVVKNFKKFTRTAC